MSPDGRFVADPVPDLPGLWWPADATDRVLLIAHDRRGAGHLDHQRHRTTGHDDAGTGPVGPLPEDALVTRGLW